MTQGPHYREGKWAVSPYNYDAKVNAGKHMPKKVQLLDLTALAQRQVEGVSLRLEDVLEYARRADAVRHRAGKGTAHMAEDFAFNQILGDRGAIDGDEGPGLAG